MRPIDADALIEHLRKDPLFGFVEQYGITGVIESAPTIDPVKHGKWVDVMTEEWCTFDECKCSVCGVVEYFNKGWKKFSYCPNCGSFMGEKDDET